LAADHHTFCKSWMHIQLTAQVHICHFWKLELKISYNAGQLVLKLIRAWSQTHIWLVLLKLHTVQMYMRLKTHGHDMKIDKRICWVISATNFKLISAANFMKWYSVIHRYKWAMLSLNAIFKGSNMKQLWTKKAADRFSSITICQATSQDKVVTGERYILGIWERSTWT
jgi:hypothetical protein